MGDYEMPVTIRGQSDSDVGQVADALEAYSRQHPDARIEVYRYSSVSIRMRIIDPDLEGTSRSDRHEIIWRFLENLPEMVQSQVSLLLAFTPDETSSSFANMEFENPVPLTL